MAFIPSWYAYDIRVYEHHIDRYIYWEWSSQSTIFCTMIVSTFQGIFDQFWVVSHFKCRSSDLRLDDAAGNHPSLFWTQAESQHLLVLTGWWIRRQIVHKQSCLVQILGGVLIIQPNIWWIQIPSICSKPWYQWMYDCTYKWFLSSN